MIKAKLFFSVNYPYPYVGNRRLYIFIRAGICHSAYCFGSPIHLQETGDDGGCCGGRRGGGFRA